MLGCYRELTIQRFSVKQKRGKGRLKLGVGFWAAMESGGKKTGQLNNLMVC